MLCERCNNIHHDRDASFCAKKNSNNSKYVKNWIKLEKDKQEKGFFPNEKDKQDQINNIKEMTKDLISFGFTLPKIFGKI